jgi:hypothetical protein
MANDITDRRASIRPKPSDEAWDDLICPEKDPKTGNANTSHPLWPLRKEKRGLIFPYTPQVSFNPMSNYNSQNFSHSNYAFNSWENSDVGDITVMAEFTANTDEEARYMLAVIHFLKGSMKGGFGRNDKQRGVPPGVYNFNYLGALQFPNVPVVITSTTLDYAKDVDYVSVDLSDKIQTWVPTHMNIIVMLRPQYNIKTLSDNFSLEKFRKGDFLQGHNGGFL